jgi:hypothetical protein
MDRDPDAGWVQLRTTILGEPANSIAAIDKAALSDRTQDPIPALSD